MLAKIKQRITKAIHFLTHGIWRITEGENKAKKTYFFNIIKAFILTLRNINGSKLNTRAGALTYNTLLSIIPLLAVLFGIARGFGFQNIVESQLLQYFSGQRTIIEKSMEFIDKSLKYAQGGLFLGIGVVLLLFSVISLISSIEDSFNIIWRIKKGRTIFRKFTDYLALIIITPVFLICNAGLSIILSSTTDVQIIDWVTSPLLKIVPFVITILLFTLIYIYIPNTKVKISAALLAGIFSGSCFQVFQILYITGQIWISKYNAIYGSFAVLPLLLLWLQLSWFICLLGVELSFAYQNINKFSFEKEITNISRRYKDFVLLLVTTLIVKRFEGAEMPYTADELSEKYKIPTQLASDTLYYLQQVGLIAETPTKDPREIAYIPAVDINLITVSYFYNRIDQYGSEDFKIDTEHECKNIWNEILNIRKIIDRKEKYTLVKDI